MEGFLAIMGLDRRTSILAIRRYHCTPYNCIGWSRSRKGVFGEVMKRSMTGSSLRSCVIPEWSVYASTDRHPELGREDPGARAGRAA